MPGGNLNCCCYRRQATDRSHRQQAYLPQCPDAAGAAGLQQCNSQQSTASARGHPYLAPGSNMLLFRCLSHHACPVGPESCSLVCKLVCNICSAEGRTCTHQSHYCSTCIAGNSGHRLYIHRAALIPLIMPCIGSQGPLWLAAMTVCSCSQSVQGSIRLPTRARVMPFTYFAPRH